MNLNPSKCQEHYINKVKNKKSYDPLNRCKKVFSKKEIKHFFMISAVNKFNIEKHDVT